MCKYPLGTFKNSQGEEFGKRLDFLWLSGMNAQISSLKSCVMSQTSEIRDIYVVTVLT